MSAAPTIEHIYCYPVKGLGGCALSEAALSAERGIAFDRQYGFAIASDSENKPDAPGHPWRPWEKFLSLKKTPACVHFSAHVVLDNGTPLLTISHRDGEQASGAPSEPQQRQTLEQFMQDKLQHPTPLRLVNSPAEPLWDEHGITLSLVNASTAVALGDGLSLTEMVTRLRPNLVFAGMPAWEEEAHGSSEVRSSRTHSEVQFKMIGGIPRCAATKVNPQTAAIDFNIPQTLVKTRGHNECGLFAAITNGGTIAIGSPLHFPPRD